MIIRIEANGYGNEVVMGTISPEVENKISDYMDENGLEDLDDFYNNDGHEELELEDWHDNDDLVHAYGPSDESEVIITDENGETYYDNVIMELADETELYEEVVQEFRAEAPNKTFFGSAMENGTWYAEIEVADDEEFDISKLGIRQRKITTYECDGEAMIFDKLTYDGEEYDFELDSSQTEQRYIIIE